MTATTVPALLVRLYEPRGSAFVRHLATGPQTRCGRPTAGLVAEPTAAPGKREVQVFDCGPCRGGQR